MRSIDEYLILFLSHADGAAMTGGFRSYLFSVCAAALLSALVPMLISQSRIRKTAEFAGALLLLIVVVSPVVRLELSDFRHIISSYMLDSFETFSSETDNDNNFLVAYILEQTETYILDKAEALGMQVETEVTLNGDTLYPLPEKVIVCGRYTSWQKEQLSSILSRDLGIPPEHQEWR